jgi:AraC-like DNA-binding protein
MLLRVLPGGTGDLSIAGPRRCALFKTTPPAEAAMLVQFGPGGAHPFFGVSLHELTDRIVRLDDLWGAEARRFLDALLAAKGAARLQILERSLVARLQQRPEPSAGRLARLAVQRITRAETGVKIEDVAASLGVSPRHLRRVFTANVGVSPKEFHRMIRLGRVLRSLPTSANWSRIAYEFGYHDQAHFIAEFRELVGMTPGRFVKSRSDGELLRALRSRW